MFQLGGRVPHPTAHIRIRRAAAGHMFTRSESWPTLNPFKAAASAGVLPPIVQLSTAGSSRGDAVGVSLFGAGAGLVSGGGGADAVQERHTTAERPLRDTEQHDGGQQLRPGQREVWYALNDHRNGERGGHDTRSRYIHCVYVLAFEQPGRQLHGGAEFRDSGQSHRQPHIHHAGLR